MSATVDPQRAFDAAAARGGIVSSLMQVEQRGADATGKCSWLQVSLVGSSAEERAAVAWVIAEAIMTSRFGRSPLLGKWRALTLASEKASPEDRVKIVAFARSVFGTPEDPGAANHVEGHVSEWLWYLLSLEIAGPTRKIALLEPPKFSVTEPGGDGFIVYEIAEQDMVFRLWELKKHASKARVSKTMNAAYTQLSLHGNRYLAQLTALHADKGGAVGDLCSQLVDCWVDADPRAGAGVGVTSATMPPPKKAFTAMGKHLNQFKHLGQLEGLLCSIEDYQALAHNVRQYVWTAL